MSAPDPRPYGHELGLTGAIPSEPKNHGAWSALIAFGGLALVLGSSIAYGRMEYIAGCRAAEAKNSIGAITRAAVTAYEREGPSVTGDPNAPSHRLCGTATPVPAFVPRGVRYMSDPRPGNDYQTGDAHHGWKCLRYDIPYPSRYRYEYRVGGDYKGPARGGPDPGPNGFEISAEGDLDGDGVTSLFTETGKIDERTHEIVLDPFIFVSKERE